MTSPSPASPVRMELPEEIATAIEAFASAAYLHGLATGDGTGTEREDGQTADRCRSALTAAILSRLREAEAGRQQAEKERDRARRGKEDDTAILRDVIAENDQLRAASVKLQEIVAADDAKAIAEYEWERANTLAEGRDKAATERNAAFARVERLERLATKLEEHRERLFEPWAARKAIWPDHPAQYRFGDGGTFTISFTNKEAREILSALSEAPPQGEQ